MHPRSPRAALRVLLLTAVSSAFYSGAGCYSGAGGTSPPQKNFYFPVGLAVSSGGGNVLYAVNSDFDLQWNGGTLQSYDLFHLRHDVAELIAANFNSCATPKTVQDIPFVNPGEWQPRCTSPLIGTTQPLFANGSRVPLGEACSPPVQSTAYFKSSATIGAFATDLQLSTCPGFPGCGTRLFSPVRGDASLTWADVGLDSKDATPPSETGAGGGAMGNLWPPAGSTPFDIQCGQFGPDGRCDGAHHTGPVPDKADTRGATLPGEPFAMAQTEDGTAIALTHQSQGSTSVLLSRSGGVNQQDAPSMQFVLTGVPAGGVGIAAVPHDKDLPVPPCENFPQGAMIPCLRPAFLETSRSAAEIDLLRYYDDDGSTLRRPFLVREVAYGLAVNQGGTDSRGIAIDSTPRLACKANKLADPATCAQLPARVFIASRSPPSLILGEIGEMSADGSFDPDRLVFTGNVPLSSGPSRVYLAPIVDRTGAYALRVFITCFDASQIFVYDPDAGQIENVINTGAGPFAMAFDPFDLNDVAQRLPVQVDVRQTGLQLWRYRFAYVASFTNSYVQVIDLADSSPAGAGARAPYPRVMPSGLPDGGAIDSCSAAALSSCMAGDSVCGGECCPVGWGCIPASSPALHCTPVSDITFERPVFTLGLPTAPKGT